MKTLLTVLALAGSLIAAAGTIPYIIETIKGKTKPRVVSWFTWALLTGVVGAAAISDQQWVSAVFAFVSTVILGSVAVAGLRYGDRDFGKLDIACQLGVFVGLGLWLLFDSPAMAVWGVIVIDLIGYIPTFKHAWQKPYEETVATYIFGAMGASLTAVSIGLATGWTVTGVAYPLYVGVSLMLLTIVLLVRGRRVSPAVDSATL